MAEQDHVMRTGHRGQRIVKWTGFSIFLQGAVQWWESDQPDKWRIHPRSELVRGNQQKVQTVDCRQCDQGKVNVKGVHAQDGDEVAQAVIINIDHNFRVHKQVNLRKSIPFLPRHLLIQVKFQIVNLLTVINPNHNVQDSLWGKGFQ